MKNDEPKRLLEDVHATLNIKLSKQKKAIGDTYNEAAPANARVKSIKLVDIGSFDEDRDEFVPLSDSFLDEVVLAKNEITLIGQSRARVKHVFKNPITVKDLLSAVEKTEQQTRAATEWFGGIDCHHIWFEGLYSIAWGS